MSCRENTGGDQVARLQFCTPWSRQLATDGTTRTRASSRRYQLLAPWYHPYMILLLLLSPACCVGWCMVHERAYSVVDCCVAEGIAVAQCCCTCSAFFGSRTTRHERAREEAATKTERRAFGGYLMHVVQFGRGVYQCALLLLCCVSLHEDTMRAVLCIFSWL